MPEWTAKREHPRYPVQVPVRHKPTASLPAQAGGGWTRNLSEGGACVQLDERLPAPSPLHLRLQTDWGAIDVEAQVVWEVREGKGGTAEGGPGEGDVLHGVAFTHLAPEKLWILRNLLHSQNHERRASVRLPVDLPVTCQPKGSEAPPLQGRTGDMSRGGLLLCFSQALPPGTPLEVTLHPSTGPITAEGEVVWVEPEEDRVQGKPIRHGLRFTALGWARALSIALLLGEVA